MRILRFGEVTDSRWTSVLCCITDILACGSAQEVFLSWKVNILSGVNSPLFAQYFFQLGNWWTPVIGLVSGSLGNAERTGWVPSLCWWYFLVTVYLVRTSCTFAQKAQVEQSQGRTHLHCLSPAVYWTKTRVTPSFWFCPSFVLSSISALPWFLLYWFMGEGLVPSSGTPAVQFTVKELPGQEPLETVIETIPPEIFFLHLLAEIHWMSAGCQGSARQLGLQRLIKHSQPWRGQIVMEGDRCVNIKLWQSCLRMSRSTEGVLGFVWKNFL